MEVKEIFNKTLNSNFLIIDEDELKSVLDNSEIIRIEDTILSDYIRVLKYDNKFFIQETSLNNDIILRITSSTRDIDLFIKERLDFYERKWDGCGCKINYYE